MNLFPGLRSTLKSRASVHTHALFALFLFASATVGGSLPQAEAKVVYGHPCAGVCLGRPVVALRFPVKIPKGARILQAGVNFTPRPGNFQDPPLTLQVTLEKSINSNLFAYHPLEKRTFFESSKEWSTPSWARVTDTQRTPNVGDILQSLVMHKDWNSDNAYVTVAVANMAKAAEGAFFPTYVRGAMSPQDNPAFAPEFHYSYIAPEDIAKASSNPNQMSSYVKVGVARTTAQDIAFSTKKLFDVKPKAEIYEPLEAPSSSTIDVVSTSSGDVTQVPPTQALPSRAKNWDDYFDEQETQAQSVPNRSNTAQQPAAPNSQSAVVIVTDVATKPIQLQPGKTSFIYVTARGSNLQYQWYENGIPLPNDKFPGLVVKYPGDNTTKRYYCVVSQKGVPGSAVKTATATVSGAVSAATSTGSIQLSWDRPVKRVDGSEFPHRELAGYKLYYSTSKAALEGTPDRSARVLDIHPDRTSTKLTGLKSGTRFYMTIKAYDIDGNHSTISNIVSVVVP